MRQMLPKVHARFLSKPPKEVRWNLVATPYGNMMIGLSLEGAVCRISFVKKGKAASVLKKWKHVWPQTEFRKDKTINTRLTRQIFLDRKAVNVMLAGTSFQHRVWKELLKIPFGMTITYGRLACRIKKPRAARAVGNALGANPVPILVPCHRVTASEGRLGGYSGGLENKARLLNKEKVYISMR